MRISHHHKAGIKYRRRGMGPAPGHNQLNRGRRASDHRAPSTYDAEYHVTCEPAAARRMHSQEEAGRTSDVAAQRMQVPPWVVSTVYSDPSQYGRKGGFIDTHS